MGLICQKVTARGPNDVVTGAELSHGLDGVLTSSRDKDVLQFALPRTVRTLYTPLPGAC